MSNNGIKDIVARDSNESFFNEYLSKEKVGENVLKGILKHYQKGKGFPIDENNPNSIGIISNIMALSNFLELYDLNAIGLNQYFYIFSDLLSLIFDSIYHNDEEIFDASPYLFNDKENGFYIDSYIETVSKVLIVMTDMRDVVLDCIEFNPDIKPKSKIEFHVNYKNSIVKKPKELLDIIEKLIIKCIRLLNESALPISQPFDYTIGNKKIDRPGLASKCIYRGWSFINYKGKNSDLYETSIYYTYHATNAFLSFYTSLYDIFNGRDTNEPFIDEYIEFKYNEDIRFYNNNKREIDDLRNKTSSAARYFEKTINDKHIDLSTDYISNNMSKISYSDVLNYQTTNAVMDTLFLTATFINGGLDEDYEFINQSNYFYDKIQFTITNIRKIYSSLQRDKKEDFINSYKLVFSEKVPTDYDSLIQKFRKNCQNIKVYDLVPLLANTYAIISKFIVQYPTRDMISYLEMVMENRNSDDKGWYWDKDGFNINNNLYYIFAIENFYDYYFKYENPLSKIGIKYNKDVLAARALADKRSDENKILKKKIESLDEKLKSKKSDLDKAVEDVITALFKNNISSLVDEYMEDMINQNINLCIDKKTGEQNGKSINYFELYEKYPKAILARKLAYTIHTNRIVKSVNDLLIDNNKKYIDEVYRKMIQQYEDEEIK